jgi:short subunit dehydrogenase-like uncharacterized protein
MTPGLSKSNDCLGGILAKLAPSQFSACNDGHGTTTTLDGLRCHELRRTDPHALSLRPVRHRRRSALGDRRAFGKKLRELHGSLYPKAAKLPQIVANAGDEKALREMCAESRVVISTVGPYALYGEPLVKICANTGTDYCDLTGEVQWIRRMIRKYEGAARASGARIVHCCGFDSIPSDLGVHFLQKHAMQKYGRPVRG